MFQLLTIAIVLGVGVVAGVGFVLFQRQNQIAERDAFQALAARRGWALTIAEQKLGRPAVLRLTSRSGLGWTAQTRRHSPSDTGATPPQTTDYEAEEPRWADGMLVIGPAIPPGAGLPPQPLDTTEGQRFLARFLGEDVAKYSAVLVHYPTDAGITVFASADPMHHFDFGDIAKPIIAWEGHISGDKGRPILILGPEGMRLRLRHGTRRADPMERFIDLALDLGRVL